MAKARPSQLRSLSSSMPRGHLLPQTPDGFAEWLMEKTDFLDTLILRPKKKSSDPNVLYAIIYEVGEASLRAIARVAGGNVLDLWAAHHKLPLSGRPVATNAATCDNSDRPIGQ